MMIALKKIGPKKVAIRNHFDRTRSRYSRLMIAQSLAMSGHSLLDAARPDFLQENLMERWLDHLESLHGSTRFDYSLEQRLRIGARRHLDLEEPVRVISALHQRVVAQYRGYASHSISFQGQRHVPLSVLFLHTRHSSVENLFSPRDDAHRIAQPLGVVHEVSAEDHGLAALLELDDGVLERLCVDRIESAERLVEDHGIRIVQQRPDELDPLLQSAG